MNKEFSKRNLKRCEAPNGFNHPLDSWSASDWMVAMVGEVGESANILKKLNRVRDAIPGNKERPYELVQKFKEEIADAYIYMDLLCQAMGVDLEQAVYEVFDRKSKEIGYTEDLESS